MFGYTATWFTYPRNRASTSNHHVIISHISDARPHGANKLGSFNYIGVPPWRGTPIHSHYHIISFAMAPLIRSTRERTPWAINALTCQPPLFCPKLNSNPLNILFCNVIKSLSFNFRLKFNTHPFQFFCHY